MSYYRIYVLDSSDNIVGGAPGEYDSDEAAIAAARQRLEAGQVAEVSTERGHIFRIQTSAAPALRQAARQGVEPETPQTSHAASLAASQSTSLAVASSNGGGTIQGDAD